MTSFVEPDFFEGGIGEWPFAPLEPQAYSLIVIDPPWHFTTRSDKGDGKSPQAQYQTMSMREIGALPVADLASPAGCLLWLWCTSPALDVQIQIMKGWGFRFVTSGVWVKTTTNGKLAFGTGYALRGCSEPFVLGAIGNPETVSKSVRSVIMDQVREHSRKPDSAYTAARALIPYGRAADVFSRETRDGFESFGNQAGLFDDGSKPQRRRRAKPERPVCDAGGGLFPSGDVAQLRDHRVVSDRGLGAGNGGPIDDRLGDGADRVRALVRGGAA